MGNGRALGGGMEEAVLACLAAVVVLVVSVREFQAVLGLHRTRGGTWVVRRRESSNDPAGGPAIGGSIESLVPYLNLRNPAIH